jgi:hypothetical protein
MAPSPRLRIPIPRPDLQVPGDKVQLLFRAASVPHGSVTPASRVQLAPAPLPRSPPPPPPRAGNCHASPARLHQLSSSLGLLGLGRLFAQKQPEVRSRGESNRSMKREGAEPSGRVGGAEGGGCDAYTGRNALRGGTVSCQSLLVCPPPGVGPAASGWGRSGRGAIKWRRGRSEAQSFAQALARLPEVKSGRDVGSAFFGWAGAGGACCFFKGTRTPFAPLRDREALALLGKKGWFSLLR